MKQQTISDVEYSARKRKTKREEFLEIMDEIIPCVVPQLQSLHAGTCRTVFQKNSRSPDKGGLCPFGPPGADYRESDS